MLYGHMRPELQGDHVRGLVNEVGQREEGSFGEVGKEKAGGRCSAIGGAALRKAAGSQTM